MPSQPSTTASGAKKPEKPAGVKESGAEILGGVEPGRSTRLLAGLRVGGAPHLSCPVQTNLQGAVNPQLVLISSSSTWVKNQTPSGPRFGPFKVNEHQNPAGAMAEGRLHHKPQPGWVMLCPLICCFRTLRVVKHF